MFLRCIFIIFAMMVSQTKATSCKERLCRGIVNRDCIIMCSSVGGKRSGSGITFNNPEIERNVEPSRHLLDRILLSHTLNQKLLKILKGYQN